MDFRRVFLAYLEASNSILAKNQKICRMLLNLPIFPLFPLFGVPWAAVVIEERMQHGCHMCSAQDAEPASESAESRLMFRCDDQPPR